MNCTVYKKIKSLSFLCSAYLLLIFSPGCGDKQKNAQVANNPQAASNKPMAIQVDGYIVKKKSLGSNVEVPGTLIANESTELHPQISERIVQLNASEGKTVAKGTLIAKLYDADLQATLKKLQVQLQIAKQNEERSAELLKIQGISHQDYDASLLTVNNIKADIEFTEATIVKTEIRAPFNGRVGLKNISMGAFVTPTTVIASIQQTDILKLDFSVPEKYTARIKVGQEVSFTVEGGSKKYTAKIMATEAGVTQETRSLMIRAIVQNKDAGLVPGVFAKVVLDFDPDPNAIVVPTQAILPQARGKKVIVYNGGVAKFVDVTTGIRDSSNIQIVSGLKAGDTIVTTGLLTVRPDSQLELNKITN
ncbi:MAG: efflux RND transporter periplasmic adaptor subunit [Bacteroidetes bacterium]|nr:efflux RND transporter periplasmic adaptor subunit [Bacteroidota bacterium]